MAVIKKLSLVDQVYEKLKESIVTMEIPMGTRLNVSKLQEEYGVSSTPVREAMNRLLNDGLIEFENNVGARVVELSQQDIRELLEVSISYELAALCFAIHKSDCVVLGDEFSVYLERYRESKDNTEYRQNLCEMKQVMYRGAQNKRLSQRVIAESTQSDLLFTVFNFAWDGKTKIYQDILPFLEEINRAIYQADIAKGAMAIERSMHLVEQYMSNKIEQMKEEKL